MSHTAISEEKYFKEVEDSANVFEVKVSKLMNYIRASKHFIVFTGAGVSTSAGIPDFRGPDGVWTLAAQGRQASKKSTSTTKAYPTITHMALVGLQNAGVMKYLISQNCDGLHKRSGIRHDHISELHGNSNIEQCQTCGRDYLRDYACYRLGKGHDHYTGRHCVAPRGGRACNGRLLEYTIDFGQPLPTKPLELAFAHAQQADLCLVLGSSLTVSPACDIPARVKANGGNLVICNLQLTKLSSSADMHIHAPCDKVMAEVMSRLRACNIPAEIPRWVLRRHVLVQTQSTSKGVHVRAGGVDTDDPRLPATIFHEVEIEYNCKKVILTKEPFEVVISESPRSTPLEVKLQLHWMGHYDEPSVPISITLAPTGGPQLWEWRMDYTASLGTWDVVPLQNKNGDEKVDLFHDRPPTFPQFQLTVRPCISAAVEGGKPHPPSLWAASALLGDVMYVFGGAIDDFHSHDNDTAKFISAFDPQLNLWVANPRVDASIAAPCVKFPRWGLSATPNGDRSMIYLFGGFDSGSQYADLYAFTLHAPPTSSSAASTSSSSSSSSASSSPDRAVSHSPLSSPRFSHALTLIPVSNSPSPRAGHSATFVPSFGASGSPHLLVFGGCLCNNGPYVFNNELYALDLVEGKEWHQLECTGTGPSARAQHAAVLLGGEVLLISGGCNANWLFNDVYTLHLKTLQWNKVVVDSRVQLDQRLASLPLPSLVALNVPDFKLWPAAHSCVVLWENACFAALFLSGLGASPDFPNQHENQYVLLVDTVANIGQLTQAEFNGPAFSARNAHCVTVSGTRLLVFGGRNHRLRATEGGVVEISVVSSK